MRSDFLDAKQLEALKAVIDSGSITKAAEQIGKSQSAITRLIQDLETELGYSVLSRNGPKVRPTKIGLSLYRQAADYLRGLAALSANALQLGQVNRKGISIGAISALATSIVPDAIAEVSDGMPLLPISVVIDNSEMVTKAVFDRQVDIGIIGFAPDTPGIQFHWIAEVPFVALVQRDDPLAQNEAISAEDLQGRKLILASGRYRLRRMFERAFSQNIIKATSVIESSSANASISLASLPSAIALVQSSAVIGRRADHLVTVPLDFYLPFHFGAITAIGLPLSALDTALIASLEEHASQLPGYRKCESFPEFGQPL